MLDRPLGGVRAAGRVGGRSALVAGVAAAAGGEEASVREDEPAAAAGFGCTSRRFGNNKTVAPGPGTGLLRLQHAADDRDCLSVLVI